MLMGLFLLAILCPGLVSLIIDVVVFIVCLVISIIQSLIPGSTATKDNSSTRSSSYDDDYTYDSQNKSGDLDMLMMCALILDDEGEINL